VRFGGVIAVRDVSLGVDEGSVTGLIGPNGAGKTTLIDAVSGLVTSSGDITLAGKSLKGWSTHERARRGIGRTFQGLELFDELTVAENVMIGVEASRRWLTVSAVRGGRGGHQRVVTEATEILAKMGVRHLAAAYPPELSLGERKRVSVARALSGDARVVLLDEPAAGLNSEESLKLGRALRTVADTGLALLLVDHDMGLVLSVCDRIHVLESGNLIASGSSDEIRQNDRVIGAYLGDQDQAETTTT
jgi:branched-chain amino acid transport system ATP-binding protein